ncbi:sterol desaturase family protein [Pacificimonas sp. WHA3]|uniref:Sterol desaturase family protein n=1 Tax=Pacificimonas pallii TaxID=2827236 RepID=A0ABS6SHK5_9SPHN|nr:sterol desaturase family protein [Pacificimonas pallii]MBV7257899.1 sterol desaturase family protein [Pacificimonas pallii]
MSILTGLLLAFATVLFMEGFAYVMHRWVMHGFLWSLHKSHHEPRIGTFEKNDWFGVMFALPSIACIFMGTQLGYWVGLAWIGLGISLYGLIYFVFHDLMVHQRLPNRYVPKSAWMKRIVQAHKLHHAASSKHGTVSFGFLYAPPVRTLKAQLAANQAKLRAPGSSNTKTA